MPLAGIILIRQTFADELPRGWAVADATMSYKHEGRTEYQLLNFRVIGPSGQSYDVHSDKVSSRDDVCELAKNTARLFIGALGATDGTSHGIDAPDGGERPAHGKDPSYSRGNDRTVPREKWGDAPGPDGIRGDGDPPAS